MPLRVMSAEEYIAEEKAIIRGWREARATLPDRAAREKAYQRACEKLRGLGIAPGHAEKALGRI